MTLTELAQITKDLNDDYLAGRTDRDTWKRQLAGVAAALEANGWTWDELEDAQSSPTQVTVDGVVVAETRHVSL